MKQLLNGYVLVKKVQENNTDGLQFAQALESFIYEGEVVQVDTVYNEAMKEHPHKISVGDVICFIKHSGEEIPVNGENMKFIQFKDIIAIK